MDSVSSSIPSSIPSQSSHVSPPRYDGGSSPAPSGSGPQTSRGSSLGGSPINSRRASVSDPGQPPANQPAPDADLRNMEFPQLSQEGNKRLQQAKDAYKNYAEINIAQQARQALQSFVDTCAVHKSSRPDMIAALKAIRLPSSAPTDLSVNIKFPDVPSVSLIPPDEDQLKRATNDQITKWYEMALQAMDNWSQQNAQSADALAAAKRVLDDAVAALKAIREAIDKKAREMTNQPGNSQLEVDYQRFVDEGVTIKCDSYESQIEASNARNRSPANTPNPPPQPPANV